MSGIPTLFLLLDSAIFLIKPEGVQLGFPVSVTLGIGVAQLVCTFVYMVPRTSILGAILLTGYLGGAVATHVRMGHSALVVLIPAIVGILVWGGLWIWNESLREMIPLRNV